MLLRVAFIIRFKCKYLFSRLAVHKHHFMNVKEYQHAPANISKTCTLLQRFSSPVSSAPFVHGIDKIFLPDSIHVSNKISFGFI